MRALLSALRQLLHASGSEEGSQFAESRTVWTGFTAPAARVGDRGEASAVAERYVVRAHRPGGAGESVHSRAQSLPAVRRYGLKEYRAPLLQLLVDVGYALGRPVAQLQEELMSVRDAERGKVDTRSLKELVVHKFV
ncbi:hypothetical protein WMY93_032581 [Mugilogobius chulae]|uniref:Uncharacterized protein n=1 Tax=Mugilogobius chulae TaxID=88201 RepID=A0AAW0MNJ7_9GOBI